MYNLFYYVTLSIIFCSCTPINSFFGLPDDNVGEEIVEDIIEGRTGVNIDLSPASPEKK